MHASWALVRALVLVLVLVLVLMLVLTSQAPHRPIQALVRALVLPVVMIPVAVQLPEVKMLAAVVQAGAQVTAASRKQRRVQLALR